MSKKKKSALPKRIAGVKIPKKVRKGALGAFLVSKPGKALIAEALLVAGAALAGREASDNTTVRRAVRRSGEAMHDAGEQAAETGAQTADAAARLPAAFAEATRAFREALTVPQPEPAWSLEVDPPSTASPAKKKRSAAATVVPH